MTAAMTIISTAMTAGFIPGSAHATNQRISARPRRQRGAAHGTGSRRRAAQRSAADGDNGEGAGRAKRGTTRGRWRRRGSGEGQRRTAAGGSAVFGFATGQMRVVRNGRALRLRRSGGRGSGSTSGSRERREQTYSVSAAEGAGPGGPVAAVRRVPRVCRRDIWTSYCAPSPSGRPLRSWWCTPDRPRCGGSPGRRGGPPKTASRRTRARE